MSTILEFILHREGPRWRLKRIYFPISWVRVMKEYIKSNGARLSSRRMVKEYVEKFYKKALEEA